MDSNNIEINFQEELKHLIGQNVKIYEEHDEDNFIAHGTLTSIYQDFCTITLTFEAKTQLQLFYPFVYTRRGDFYIFDYNLKNLMFSKEGKEMCNSLIQDEEQQQNKLLNSRIVIKHEP